MLKNNSKMNKVILITGARKGIGAYLAQRYTLEGWEVIGCSRKEPDHRIYDWKHVDVTSEEDVVRLFRGLWDQYGRLDAVVNNAGVGGRNHVITTPYRAARKIVDTNFIGTFLVTRQAAKLMVGTGGAIVNFSSVAVPLALEGEAVYAASKAAVEAFTRCAAKELFPLGITVNCVAPGPVDTDLLRSIPTEELHNNVLSRQAAKRFCTVEDVAEAVDSYISSVNLSITGQTLYLGGV